VHDNIHRVGHFRAVNVVVNVDVIVLVDVVVDGFSNLCRVGGSPHILVVLGIDVSRGHVRRVLPGNVLLLTGCAKVDKLSLK
jgi:hypothetical protein